VTESTPNSTAALLTEAAKAADAKDWNRAADTLKDCPQTIEVLDKRAFYLSRAKRYDESREVLALLREKEPQNFLWQHMTGYQYYEEQRFAEAVPWFVEAYRLKPDHVRNLYRLAQCRRNLGEADKAARGFAHVLKLWHALAKDAQDREAKTMAKASYQLGKRQAGTDPRGAIGLLEQAVEHDAGDHDKHYMLGKTLRRVGHAEDGLEELERAQRIKPGRSYIELELADALAAAGRAQEATRMFSRLTRNLKGWQAFKGARIACDMDRLGDARHLLDVAAKTTEVRGSPRYEELSARVPEQPAAPQPTRKLERQPGGQRKRHPQRSEAATGKVDHVRRDRGFGFLVDDSDDERCYFKLPEGQDLAPGQAVSFARYGTSCGPAARDVRAAA